ncbi:MAG: hypothetical protein U0990_05710 [Candidatus Nanopelagicales bacterium]|nr:hypothetical protein [Candidatus Nanopelagicales bacterium]MDZ4249570.1 hypothetical protein [Candidatus Nanopelagicales bacterium]
MSEAGDRELIDALVGQCTGAERYAMDDGTDNIPVVVRISPDRVVFRG